MPDLSPRDRPIESGDKLPLAAARHKDWASPGIRPIAPRGPAA